MNNSNKIKSNFFTVSGILLFIITTLIDKFILEVNISTYILLSLISLFLIIYGIYKNKKITK